MEYLGWYKNFVKFREKYFPLDKLGVSDRLLLKKSTHENYERLKRLHPKQRVTGTDLLREVERDMIQYGFKPRKIA